MSATKDRTPLEWADTVRKEKYKDSAESQRAVDILQAVLLGELAPPDAANKVVGYYPLPNKANHFMTELGRFWEVLCEAILTFGKDRQQAERLADLVIVIQSFPDPPNHDWRLRHWKDLPGWFLMFHDVAIDPTIRSEHYPHNEWPWQEAIEPLLNATIFAATLWTRAPFETGFDRYIGEAMSWALDKDESSWEAEEDHFWAEVYMPSAATWILAAGWKLRAACVNLTRFDDRTEPPFCPEKWNDWKRRFEVLATDLKFSENSREWAARAAPLMEPITK